MLTPRYLFAGDFQSFHDYFCEQPHLRKRFAKGSCLWRPGQPCEAIHYILSGMAMNYADHESGRRKIISFHGAGTVFPGYHQTDYRIELSLVTTALTDMEVLEFTIPQFRAMFESNTALSEQVVSWYAMYVNRLLFETVHQEYNSSLGRISNLLYLLAAGQPEKGIEMTQEELSDLLGLSRVPLTRGLSALRQRGIVTTARGRLRIKDPAALAQLCSSETI